MTEIEVKILDIKQDDVIRRLTAFGAVKEYDGDIDVTFYDFPDRRLESRNQRLRLRRKEKISELTFKQKLPAREAKIAEEAEVKVNDFERMKEILTVIGLEQIRDYRKHRKSYIIGKVRFEIDSVPGIPTFLEIEAPSIEEIQTWVKKLGFSLEEAKPWSGSEVLRYYGKS